MVGRVSGLYGVEGWVKVHSYTEPRENILGYAPWRLLGEDGTLRARVASSRHHGRGLVVRLEGIGDREQARRLLGAEIAVPRTELPAPAPGEYYWVDLVGLRVVSLGGAVLGRVDGLMATGANDVLVVRGERERLLPFIDSVVLEVDFDAGAIRVDWDPDF